MWIVVVIVGAASALYGAHRLLLYADARGWVYYRTKPKLRGSSLGLIEEIYNPAVTHVVDEQQSKRTQADHESSGDPPSTDGSISQTDHS